MWLLDFLHFFLGGLLDNHTSKLSEVASHAYKKGLGPHHPWIIRQGAKMAMIAVPSREHFLHETCANYEDIGEFKVSLDKVRAYIWEYYRSRSLDTLP